MEQAVENEARCQAVNFATEDTAEALAAFAQKREPIFTGRLGRIRQIDWPLCSTVSKEWSATPRW